MGVPENLKERWNHIDYLFLVHSSGELKFNKITEQKSVYVKASEKIQRYLKDFTKQSIQ